MCTKDLFDTLLELLTFPGSSLITLNDDGSDKSSIDTKRARLEEQSK